MHLAIIVTANSPVQTVKDERVNICESRGWSDLGCEQWFEDKTEQLDLMEHDLQELHTSIELLVTNRKGEHIPVLYVCFCHMFC